MDDRTKRDACRLSDDVAAGVGILGQLARK
jgi:hypothetical protein